MPQGMCGRRGSDVSRLGGRDSSAQGRPYPWQKLGVHARPELRWSCYRFPGLTLNLRPRRTSDKTKGLLLDLEWEARGGASQAMWSTSKDERCRVSWVLAVGRWRPGLFCLLLKD